MKNLIHFIYYRDLLVWSMANLRETKWMNNQLHESIIQNVMKNPIFNFMVLVLLLLSSGCVPENENEIETYLIPEDMRFVNQPESRFTYKSNTGKDTTFRCAYYFGSENHCNNDYADIVWGEKCWESEYCYVKIYPETDSLLNIPYPKNNINIEACMFYMVYDATGHHNIYVYGDMFEYYCILQGNRSKTSHGGFSENDSTGNIQVNGRTYNVDIFEFTNTDSLGIKTAYISSKYGVMKYDLNNAESWELQNAID